MPDRSLLTSRLPRFLDPLHRTGRACYVTGSARSGTTWLAQLAVDALRARFLFEPLHHRSPIPDVPHFRPRGTASPALRHGIHEALTGRLRDERVDRFQKRRGIYRCRVVKDIRPGLLPAVREVAPRMPVAYLVRHPLQVAVSQAALDAADEDWWDTTGAIAELHRHAADPADPLHDLASRAVAAIEAEPSRFGALVAIWCVENVLGLRAVSRGPAVALRHADLVRDPTHHLRAVGDLYGTTIEVSADLRQPSRTSFRGAGAITEPAAWRDTIDRATARRLLALVDSFGLGALYGTDPDVAVPPLPVPVAELRPTLNPPGP